LIGSRSGGDDDGPVGGRVFDGVIEKIEEHAATMESSPEKLLCSEMDFAEARLRTDCTESASSSSR
jgi:hypothetical protein